MTTRLIATKSYLPAPRQGLVVRPRLFERLERATEAALTLVSAPAGFGKTTLVAAWLRERLDQGSSVAWLSLDQTDDHPEVFWAYTAAALRQAVPSLGQGAPEQVMPSPFPTELVLTNLLNELALAPNEVWLVLDDYHLLRSDDIRDGLAFLLSHLPPRVHVVIITRADPDLPLARWRVRQELVEIRAADLRFTQDEAATYLDAVPGVDLDAADVTVLAERTEGWIAALQLAALSLQGRADASAFVAQFAGDDRYVVDYLIDEVLQDQPDAVRGFLLQSSVLEQLTGPLCDAVTGRGDGTEMLVALERANLFLVALDDRREWYRYHHLFGDVLRARLLSEQPHQVPVLHRRASDWYESQDLTAQAITHALAARNFHRAGHLMELAMPTIRRNRQDAVMYGWLVDLPDGTVRHSPVLSVFYGSMLMVSGDLEAAERRLDDAEHALAVATAGEAAWADTEEQQTLPATIAIYRASLAQARGEVAATAEHAQRALDLARPDDHLARGGAAGFLGLAAWAQGDVMGALQTFGQAVVSLHAAGNVVDELSSTVVLADLWLVAGRPTRARELYRRALARAEAQGPSTSRAAAELRVGLSELDVELGDLGAALQHLEFAEALTGPAPVTESRYRWFVARALLAQTAGDPDQAVDLLERAEQLHRPGYFPEVRPVAAVRARIWIGQGLLSRAADWAHESGVTTTDQVSYLREFDHLTLVRLLLAEQRADGATSTVGDAAGLLARLFRAAEASGRAGSLLEIGLLQALVHDAQGDRSRAVTGLADALARVPEPEGYARLLLSEGAPVVSLLHEVRSARPGDPQIARLLALDAANETAAGTEPVVATASVEPLSARELEVLKLLDTELSGPEIARQLFVSPNTMRTHTKHIFTKLDVSSRRSAVRRARERGLI